MTDESNTTTNSAPRYSTLLRWILPALTVLIVLAPTLYYPIGPDQGVFAYMGRIINEGGMPYRNTVDIKPPGISIAYAMVTRLSHDSSSLMIWLHRVDIVLAMCSGILVALLCQRWGHAQSSWAAATWFAAFYYTGQHEALAQAETWAVPFMLAAILLCFRIQEAPQRRFPLFILIGLCMGIALLLKFTTVFPILPFLCWGIWRWGASEESSNTPVADSNSSIQMWLERGGRVICIGLGIAIPLLVVGLWLVRGEAWADFREVMSFVSRYASLGQEGPMPTGLSPNVIVQRLGSIVGYTAGWMQWMWFPVSLAILAVASEKGWKNRGIRLMCLALIGGFCGVWLQNKFLYYHWQPALPFLAILAAVGIENLIRVSGLPKQLLPVGGVVIALCWNGYVQWPNYRDGALFATGQLPARQWWERFHYADAFSFTADQDVASYVQQHSQTTDTIMVWGFEAPIYILAERKAPTRFISPAAVIMTGAPPQWQHEFLTGMKSKPPLYFIAATHDVMPWITGHFLNSVQELHQWKELDDWIQHHYRVETQIEDFTLYRRVS